MNIKELENKRIAVLLSGGVDSSVVLYELVRQGLQPDCFYIKIGPEEEEEWDCSSEEDLEMATAVSHKYGCKLEVIDCHREYWDQVTQYTMDKVRAGLTPNPDVMCNRLIKFGAFHEKRGHDYDLIATGHYATTERDPANLPCLGEATNTPPTQGEKERVWLCTSPDPVKDQTDFLAQIYDWQLAKALFPIGHMMKDEVREIAEREHLVNAKRKDSQGICFLGKINYNDYLRRYLGELPGDVVELETGKLIGHHKGHWFHTIGQRKGMGLGGGPWFVVKKDIEQNIIYVSHGYDPETAYKQDFPIRDFHHLTLPLEECFNYPLTSHPSPLTPHEVTIKIRHTPEFIPATLEPQGNGRYLVHAAQPIHGVAPGQFCVIYDNRHHRCYGSGEITI
ncbi:MAG: tRNA 2-thiouridine(34) synthase MnmA [Prevotella sp.]|nr:tRNA 2-thiouridine(34) synthase MnmA [Prevotella sp.]